MKRTRYFSADFSQIVSKEAFDEADEQEDALEEPHKMSISTQHQNIQNSDGLKARKKRKKRKLCVEGISQ